MAAHNRQGAAQAENGAGIQEKGLQGQEQNSQRKRVFPVSGSCTWAEERLVGTRSCRQEGRNVKSARGSRQERLSAFGVFKAKSQGGRDRNRKNPAELEATWRPEVALRNPGWQGERNKKSNKREDRCVKCWIASNHGGNKIDSRKEPNWRENNVTALAATWQCWLLIPNPASSLSHRGLPTTGPSSESIPPTLGSCSPPLFHMPSPLSAGGTARRGR